MPVFIWLSRQRVRVYVTSNTEKGPLYHALSDKKLSRAKIKSIRIILQKFWANI